MAKRIGEIFAKNLLDLLKSKNWDRKQLADKLDAHRNTVGDWLSGRLPPEKQIERIADLFGVEEQQLFRDPDTPPTIDEALKVILKAMGKEK